jgi:DNA-binding CsgD family transcriptional regulator
VYDGSQVIGAIVHFAPAASSVAAAKPRFGWASLTDAERSVAELVAEGLTNRAIALRLFLSPYTVDAHLRHVFAKLGIASRVELTRVVVERDRAGRSSGPAAEEVDQLDL